MAISYVTLINIQPGRSPQVLTHLRDDTVFNGFTIYRTFVSLRGAKRRGNLIKILFSNFNSLSKLGKSTGFTAGDENLSICDLIEHKILSAGIQL